MQRQMLIIKLDGDHFGIDVRLIQEVIKHYNLRPLPDAPNFIEGITSLRDSIVPLIKIKRLLNSPLFDLYKQKKVIILNFGEGVKIGVLVDDVVGIHYYDDKEIRSVDTISRSNVLEYVIGVVQRNDIKVAILDVFAMFFTNKGDFLYTQYFKKGVSAEHRISKKEYYKLKEKIEKIDFPFNEVTQSGIVKHVSKIASLRGKPIESILHDRSIFERSHFLLEQKRRILFENQPDMYMINDALETFIKTKKRIKVWMLGNGHGEDAYSLAILFLSYENAYKEVTIINSDENLDMLTEGQRGRFTKEAFVNIPGELWPNYFDKEGDEYKIKSFIKKNIVFDFYKPNPKHQPFDVDIIYAPNYFARYSENTNEVLRSFCRALNPGGILALGLFENIEGFAKNLKKYYIKNRLVFIKE